MRLNRENVKGKVKGYADINRFEKRNYTYAMERTV